MILPIDFLEVRLSLPPGHIGGGIEVHHRLPLKGTLQIHAQWAQHY